MSQNKELGASAADATDRVGGLRPEPQDASQPFGRSPTGARFTPGPWRLRADPYEDGEPYYYIEAGAGFHGGEAGEGFGLCGIVKDEDAYLIAAAPDLYDALESIQRCADGGEPPSMETILALNAKASAALAKARGES